MKKIIFRIAAVLILVFTVSFFNNVKAQSSNTIEEIKLNPNDGFGELRKLVINNFDFTNPNFTEGVVNSDVQFSIAENGKITNVHAKGDCKYVSEELENVLSHLLYKVDTSKLSKNMIASTYVMPVSVRINR
ncbi:hypothetical protein MTP09_03855 [Chryseobacterium suipulveris]|uniref:TonB C-terminal domain-containing protein n=1 Tax=Chryseobacterium suipulveris TaxID=2929800 RepID=A0ABY4BRE8_9FLAO|nr:hypothetical protein [Chryseobacterium suipulveris]UOE41780.1 hypothetical protein MTP09_03855 [Chryseobacterium suipulveris]